MKKIIALLSLAGIISCAPLNIYPPYGKAFKYEPCGFTQGIQVFRTEFTHCLDKPSLKSQIWKAGGEEAVWSTRIYIVDGLVECADSLTSCCSIGSSITVNNKVSVRSIGNGLKLSAKYIQSNGMPALEQSCEENIKLPPAPSLWP